MLIKICGITNVEDGIYSYESGSDLIGVILSNLSPRRGTVDLVNKLAGMDIPVVSVYTSMKDALINSGEEKYAQLHFRADLDGMEKIRESGRKIISVVNLDDPDYIKYLETVRGGSDLILLEKKSGIMDIIDRVSPFIHENVGIAGKIGPGNIDRIMKFHPEFVDLSSSLERYPGKKDQNLVDTFFKRLKYAELIN